MGRKEELLPASYSERKREATSWVTWRDEQPRSDAGLADSSQGPASAAALETLFPGQSEAAQLLVGRRGGHGHTGVRH